MSNTYTLLKREEYRNCKTKKYTSVGVNTSVVSEEGTTTQQNFNQHGVNIAFDEKEGIATGKNFDNSGIPTGIYDTFGTPNAGFHFKNKSNALNCNTLRL
jgi:hypothetical protein